MGIKLTENSKTDTKITQKIFKNSVILVTVIYNVWRNVEKNTANKWNKYILVEKENLNEIILSWTERW